MPDISFQVRRRSLPDQAAWRKRAQRSAVDGPRVGGRILRKDEYRSGRNVVVPESELAQRIQRMQARAQPIQTIASVGVATGSNERSDLD
jgi:hypothetical protein